ncbi:MAG: AMP nucleosidase [Pseudomonadota bacterium]
MSEEPDRVTILAKEFSAAALEFHRGKMAQKGYRLEGSILPRRVQIIEGMDAPKDLFDGDVMFAVTFVRQDGDA